MPAFIDLTKGDIKGESDEQGHKDWVYVKSISGAIMRSIAEGATGVKRSNGETSLGDIVVSKTWDTSTPKLASAVANGVFLSEVVIHLCSTINKKNVTNLEIKLKDVILSSYHFMGTSEQDPVPSEEITMNYTSIEWTYEKFDTMGKSAGKVPGKYDTQKAKS